MAKKKIKNFSEKDLLENEVENHNLCPDCFNLGIQ